MNVKLGVVRLLSISLSPLMQGDSGTEAASDHFPIRGIRGPPAPPCFFLHGCIFEITVITFPYYPIPAPGTLKSRLCPDKRSHVN